MAASVAVLRIRYMLYRYKRNPGSGFRERDRDRGPGSTGFRHPLSKKTRENIENERCSLGAGGGSPPEPLTHNTSRYSAKPDNKVDTTTPSLVSRSAVSSASRL